MRSPSLIRAQVPTEACALLDAIWKHHRENEYRHDGWPGTQGIHIAMGKEKVQDLLTKIPDGAVYVTPNAPPRYALSLLGVLLTSFGPELERALIRFLDLITAMAQDNPDLSNLDGLEVTKALRLPADRALLVGRLVYLAGLWSGSFSGGPRWSCDVPADLDDLISMQNFSGYLWAKAEREAEGIAQGTRRWSGPAGSSEASPLWFIRSKALREVLERDLKELRTLPATSAPKSTVLLCGGVLEGILLDELNCRPKLAKGEFRRIRGASPEPINRWVLGDLVDVAHGLGLLPAGTAQLSHALREFRNLIHPGKSRRTRARVSAEEARAARAALDVVLKHFAARGGLRRTQSSRPGPRDI